MASKAICSGALHNEHAQCHLIVTLKSRKKHNAVSQLIYQGSSETSICVMCVLSLPKVMSYETQVMEKRDMI